MCEKEGLTKGFHFFFCNFSPRGGRGFPFMAFCFVVKVSRS